MANYGRSLDSRVDQYYSEYDTSQRNSLRWSQPSPFRLHTGLPTHSLYNSSLTPMSSHFPVDHHKQNETYRQSTSQRFSNPNALHTPYFRQCVNNRSIITRNNRCYSNEIANFHKKPSWNNSEYRSENINSTNSDSNVEKVSQNSSVATIDRQRTVLRLSEWLHVYLESASNQNNSDKVDSLKADVKYGSDSSKSAERKKGAGKGVSLDSSTTVFGVKPPHRVENSNEVLINKNDLNFKKYNIPLFQKMFSGGSETYKMKNSFELSNSSYSIPHRPTYAEIPSERYFLQMHNSSSLQYFSENFENDTGTPVSLNDTATVCSVFSKSAENSKATLLVSKICEELEFAKKSSKTSHKQNANKDEYWKPAAFKPAMQFTKPNGTEVGAEDSDGVDMADLGQTLTKADGRRTGRGPPKNLKEEKEIVAKEDEDNDGKVDDEDSILDASLEESEEKVLNGVNLVKPIEGGIDDEDVNKKPVKTKLINERSIDDKIEQTSVFKPRFGKRNKKSMFPKGKNISREVIIPDEITIKELSIRMAEDSQSVLQMLKEEIGESYGVDDLVDPDIACEIVKKFNHTAKRMSDASKEKDLFLIKDRESLPKKPKPPVVTFMGHVDHGKTSLLDAFRESNVAKRESGGITQHIGAYQIITKDKQKITFIDTPGHEAFTAMRARGANITNIVVIVVAADDGVMKQTIEAINHAKAANVSIIVAINKIDKQSGDVQKVINNLPQYDLIPEELGGDVMVVPVSAKKKMNLDKLEEAILFIAELMELEAIEDCRALGWVIESKVDKAKGISATLIIEEGTLKIGDLLVLGITHGKVRSMVNHLGQKEKTALPSTPIEITGLNSVPNAGDKFVVVNSEKQAREIIEYRLQLIKKKEENSDTFSCDDSGSELLSVILKCDVTGSVEAISSSIDKLGKDEVKLKILHKAVGAVTDSDLLLAEASGAMILAFNVKVDARIRSLAKQKRVKIHPYKVIYELIDDIKMHLNKMLKPITREVQVGSATVRQIFSTSKAGSIIGCCVSDGVVKKDSLIKVMRSSKLIYEGKLQALRRFKDDVKEVGSNFECGMSLDGKVDVKVGDVIEVYQFVQEERKL